jgi:hypothetical protein
VIARPALSDSVAAHLYRGFQWTDANEVFEMNKRLVLLLSAMAVTVACSSQRSAPPASGENAGPDLAQRPPQGNQAAANASHAPAAPVEKEPPRFREVVIPEGTTLNLTLETSVSSNNSRPEDPVRATLAKSVVIDGATVIQAGAVATGTVLQSKESGRVKGRASVSFSFDRLRVGDETHTIHTARISRQARATKGDDAKKIGIGAGAGAVIGAIAGGGKGAAIGSAIGAGAGTGVVASTRGKEVHLAPGTAVKTTLSEPMTIQVPLS